MSVAVWDIIMVERFWLYTIDALQVKLKNPLRETVPAVSWSVDFFLMKDLVSRKNLRLMNDIILSLGYSF